MGIIYRLPETHQLFLKMYLNYQLMLIVSNTTDYFQIAGGKYTIEIFFGQFNESFIVGKSIIETRSKF